MSRQLRNAVILTQAILLLIGSAIFFTGCQRKNKDSRPIIIKFGATTAGGEPQIYSEYTFTTTGAGEVRIPQGPTVNQLDVTYEDGSIKEHSSLQDCHIEMRVENAQGYVGDIIVRGEVNPVTIKFGGRLRPDQQQTCSGCTVKSISCSACKKIEEGKITSVTIWPSKRQ